MQIFPVCPVSRGSFMLLMVAAATCIIPAAVLWFAPGAQVSVAIVFTIILSGVAGVIAWFGFAQHRSTVVITERDVTLNIPFYGRTIALDRLIPDSIRKATFGDTGPYRLRLRTNGLSVPGYQLGWFTTQGAGRVLAAISAEDVVVWQTIDDYGVVVSVRDCDGLIRAVRTRRRAEPAS